ncbi:unnamed protein product [Eretmochelys imbricata]
MRQLQRKRWLQRVSWVPAPPQGSEPGCVSWKINRALPEGPARLICWEHNCEALKRGRFDKWVLQTHPGPEGGYCGGGHTKILNHIGTYKIGFGVSIFWVIELPEHDSSDWNMSQKY